MKNTKSGIVIGTLVLTALLVMLAPQIAMGQAAPASVVINEIHADPAADLAGDANGDGTRDTSDDEFVEIVNVSGGDMDISGWTLADGNAVRHVFPDGTVIPAGCAIVVFGGGSPAGEFGDAIVQTASTGQLGLNNSGDVVTLSDGITDQATAAYGSEGGDNQSITLDPDASGSVMVKHSMATGSGGALFSPGTMIDGSPFSGCVCCEPQPGTIIVEKQTDPDGAAESFAFNGDVAGAISDGQQLVVSGLLPGTYTSQEEPLEGWILTSIECDDDDSAGDVTSGVITFDLDSGETVKCTCTNTQQTPSPGSGIPGVTGWGIAGMIAALGLAAILILRRRAFA